MVGENVADRSTGSETSILHGQWSGLLREPRLSPRPDYNCCDATGDAAGVDRSCARMLERRVGPFFVERGRAGGDAAFGLGRAAALWTASHGKVRSDEWLPPDAAGDDSSVSIFRCPLPTRSRSPHANAPGCSPGPLHFRAEDIQGRQLALGANALSSAAAIPGKPLCIVPLLSDKAGILRRQVIGRDVYSSNIAGNVSLRGRVKDDDIGPPSPVVYFGLEGPKGEVRRVVLAYAMRVFDDDQTAYVNANTGAFLEIRSNFTY